MRVIQKALTFDDVLLLPAHSRVLPRQVSLKTRLTRKLDLNIPLMSAAMDTVTEARLAIAIAQEGGIGIIHKNFSPKEHAAEVAKVKRFESGVLRDPMTIAPDMRVRQVIALQKKHRISGFPVISAGKVVGIVTNRDLRFEKKLDQPVRNIMTPQKRLVTVNEGASRADALALLHKHRLERVLVVDKQWHLKGLVTVKDIIKETEHPNACKDSQGKLRAGAAVGVGEGTEERVELLIDAGVDVLGFLDDVLDRDQALQAPLLVHHKYALEAVLVQQRQGVGPARTFAYGHQPLLRRHDVAHRLVELLLETQIPVGDDTDDFSRRDHRETGDPVLLLQCDHLTHAHVRRDGHGIA